MKIYVASSWKNLLQPGIVHALKRCGHDVYDFRHPEPGNDGFHWKEVMPSWDGSKVEPNHYVAALKHPIAQKGYENDITALRNCDAVVAVMPFGRSASWEFGYAMGLGKKGYVIMLSPDEPDLMFMEADIITSMDDFFKYFGEPVVL